MSMPEIRAQGTMEVSVPNNLTTIVSINRALTIPNPITASSVDLPKINSALEILNNPINYRPSTIAKIQGPLSACVQNLDDAFTLALEDYNNSLVEASANDMALRDIPINYPTLYAGITGAIQLPCNYAPDTIVIKEVSSVFLAIIGFFWGIYNSATIADDKNKENKSINRKNWAIYVLSAEEKRLRDSVKLIKLRANALAGQIKASADNALDVDAIEEVEQINRVMQAISTTPLQITHNGNSIPADQFLLQYAPATI